MNYKSLLIVTYGRSGSTLLQGLLNTVDGILIKGENNGFLFDLYQSYRKLQNAQQLRQHQSNPVRPWYGVAEYKLDVYLQMLETYVQQSVVGDKAGVKCYGFKEIRYLQMHRMQIEKVELEQNGMKYRMADCALADYLNFLRQLLPDCAIIVNTRRHDEVLASAWWQDLDQSQVRNQLQLFEQEALNYVQANDYACHVDFADVCSQAPGFWQMFDFLGVTADRDRINELMTVPHSYAHKPSTLRRTGG